MPEKKNSSEKTADELKSRSILNRFFDCIGISICGKSVDDSRLWGEITHCWKKLEYLKKDRNEDHWSKPAEDLLECASNALKEKDTDLGWRYLDYARSFLYLGMDGDDFRAEAQAIINEAKDPKKNVNAWRMKTIQDDLCEDCKLKKDLKKSEVFNASMILFESHHNRYIKIRRIKRQLIILACFAALTLVVLLRVVPPFESLIVWNNNFILSTALFGILGASISGILSVARTGAETKIPDQLIDFWILLAKLVVGAASAFVLFAFVSSGDILVFNPKTTAQIMAISFAAGFSERLVTSAVESVANK